MTTNAEKAFELLNKLDFEDGKFEITDALIEMAKWKEQQMIEWIKDNAAYFAHWEWNGDTYEKEVVFDAEECVEAFKQSMKDEESMKE